MAEINIDLEARRVAESILGIDSPGGACVAAGRQIAALCRRVCDERDKQWERRIRLNTKRALLPAFGEEIIVGIRAGKG